MNRKGSFSNVCGVKPKISSKKGSISNDLPRKSSIPVTEKLRKSTTNNLGRLSKVSLSGALISTPNKALVTPMMNRVSQSSTCSAGSVSRQSLRFSGWGVPCKKVPWDLSDSSFRSKCIDRILDFLLINSYESAVTRNSLRSPTAKDFKNIFIFIYQFLDPCIKFTRMEDTIPKLMKVLGFPGHLTKSTFLNVGSPHAWPAVLAMLAWLCDLISSSNGSYLSMFQKDFESEKNDVELKLNVIIGCYQDQNDTSYLIEEFKVEMEGMKGITDEDFKNALDLQDNAQAKLQEVPDTKQQSTDIEKNFLELQIDFDKIIQYEERLSVVLKEKDEDRISLENHRDAMQNEVDEVERNIILINEHERNQSLSKEEIQKIKSYKHDYVSSMEYYKQEENDLKQKQWQNETDLSKRRMNWSTSVCQFASLYRRIGFDSSFLSSGDLQSFNSNREEVVREIKRLGANLVSENVVTNNVIMDILKEFDQHSDNIIDAKKKHTKQEKQAKRILEERQKLNKDIKIEKEDQLLENDKLLEEIQHTRRRSESNLMEQSKLTSIIDEYKALVEKNIEEQESAKEIIAKERSNTDWFLAQKALLLSQHLKTMQGHYNKYLEQNQN